MGGRRRAAAGAAAVPCGWGTLRVRASEGRSPFAAGARHIKEDCEGLGMYVVPGQQSVSSTQGAGAHLPPPPLEVLTELWKPWWAAQAHGGLDTAGHDLLVSKQGLGVAQRPRKGLCCGPFPRHP